MYSAEQEILVPLSPKFVLVNDTDSRALYLGVEELKYFEHSAETPPKNNESGQQFERRSIGRRTYDDHNSPLDSYILATSPSDDKEWWEIEDRNGHLI